MATTKTATTKTTRKSTTIKTTQGQKFTLTTTRLTESSDRDFTLSRYAKLSDLREALANLNAEVTYSPVATFYNAPYKGHDAGSFDVTRGVLANGDLSIGCKNFSPTNARKIIAAAKATAKKRTKKAA